MSQAPKDEVTVIFTEIGLFDALRSIVGAGTMNVGDRRYLLMSVFLTDGLITATWVRV
jgi:hypothetical protein